MRVLYGLWNYPQLSETYVAAEIAYAIRRGVDVRVWSTMGRHEGVAPQCQVYRGTLAEAAADFRPDVVHFHYLVVANAHLDAVPAGVPVTVRGHSFDWSPELCRKVAAHPSVRRVYLFPHLAAQAGADGKVAALPVAYDPALHVPRAGKDRRLVVRTAAGLPNKGLDDFFAAARVAGGHRFVLAVARAGGWEAYPDDLRNQWSKGNVEVLVDLPCREAADLVGRAGIYMDTYDPRGHAFGMPISMAEAWASGAYVLARDVPDARAYMAGAGALYRDPEEAAALIRATLTWGSHEWEEAGRAAVERARAFRDDAVLPALVADWARFAANDGAIADR